MPAVPLSSLSRHCLREVESPTARTKHPARWRLGFLGQGRAARRPPLDPANLRGHNWGVDLAGFLALEMTISRSYAERNVVGERHAFPGDGAMRLTIERVLMRRVLSALALLLGLAIAEAQAGNGILNAIPDDAVGFAVVHHVSDASQSIDDLAKLVNAPPPDLLSLARKITDLQNGLDEQGDLAIVLTSVDPAPKGVVLVPVADFKEFFAALQVDEPATGVVEVQLAGVPKLVGRKGDYAAVAPAGDREALEQFLASTDNLADDASLAEWLDANRASVVITSRGIKQLLPKLTGAIRAAQAQLRGAQGEQGQFAADGLDLYVQLFTAAEPEVEQFGIGLRIDSAQTVDLVKRIQFTPGGACANGPLASSPRRKICSRAFRPARSP